MAAHDTGAATPGTREAVLGTIRDAPGHPDTGQLCASLTGWGRSRTRGAVLDAIEDLSQDGTIEMIGRGWVVVVER